MSTSRPHSGGQGGHFVLPGPIRLKSFGDDPWGVVGRNLLNLHLKPGPILSWAPRKDYDRALAQFKRDLIAKQVADRKKKHRTPLLKLPDEELEWIDKEHRNRLRKDVAKLFLRMWEEIEKARNAHPDAKHISIGVASAYRSAVTDELAWNNAFAKTYYPQTLEARLATGDEFGPDAVDVMFKFMNKRKAPPGFSGHTHGIAADLETTQKGQHYSTSAGRASQLGWQRTWLYDWLVQNAWKHKFYQLKMETFHWEYHADGPSVDCYDGNRPTKRRDVLVKV